ncbi:outer membrane protein assembly factor [Mucilaginibacter sp. RS28]|uniref:Outer membrane protein assembly factor n=1 Tax=Mucilaginibacter straminoryzae TaxID=2932774 RepID=A0A9X1X6E9_9SPHI|nr:outer membrane protein assembly factor [Mucilaginibacter straminoryzae]MCJ8211811.1 outer membrane protein assembly factor [Mucilaginibacter straminoryzae]
MAQGKADSIKVAIEPDYDKVSGAHRIFFGENYRDIWATPVKMRVFHLNQERGGLQIEERGGGMQTKSLRLKDPSGHEWVLRTIQKYPEKILPEDLRKTWVKDVVQDQISAAHPYSFLVVPPLAQALNIPHAHPEIVYIPDDPALGKYQKDFANQVFLFEEREPLDVDKTDNSDKTQKKLKSDNDNEVDQKTVLRARLLDFILGDWDRHNDQWRWERVDKEHGEGILYKPVPRDRDQVFYSTSGVLPWFVSRHLFLAKLQHYGNRIRSVNRWNLNARNFDRIFLTDLSEKDWREEIAYVQQTLSDQLLRDALKKMPPEIYKQGGDELLSKLIARRNNLTEQAIRYYRFISKVVTITGSDKQEQINVERTDDGKAKVTVYKIKKDGTEGHEMYKRTFDPDVTKEVRLFGFGGKDVFHISGGEIPLRVRMIGGEGDDQFVVDSNVDSRHRIMIYDDAKEANQLPSRSAARIKTSTDTIVNKGPEEFKYDFLQPLFLANISRDYGFELIGDFIYQKQGFRKDPYKFRQSLLVNYGFGTNSLLLNYRGEFRHSLGKSDLLVNVLSKGPNYVSNFFGTGNNSVFVREGKRPIAYYRNVYNYIDADVQARYSANRWTVNGGLRAQYYNGDADGNQNKYLKVYDQQHPAEQVFSTQVFAGLVGGFSYDSRNNESLLPYKGVYWKNSLTGMHGLNQGNKTYGQWLSEFSFYVSPTRDSAFVIADRTGAGYTVGNATYYQQLKLGGSQNLRGYYNYRFTGKGMVFNNLEVRLKLLDFESYLVGGTLGVIGFNDIGRVWSQNEQSDTWHDGYGGGLYFLPAKLILIQGVVGFSKEGAYPYISAGFRF